MKSSLQKHIDNINPDIKNKIDKIMEEQSKYYTPEYWADIPTFEGYYKVSNKGRVKRVNSLTSHGHRRRERILKQSNNVYKYICLCKNNKKKNYSVHRLVLMSFTNSWGNPLHVNHIDGDKYNNNIENLEWVTHKENAEHASKHGLVRCQNGEFNNMSKLTEMEVIKIKSMLDEGITAYKIHKYYYPHLHQQTIYGIKQGRIWNHI